MLSIAAVASLAERMNEIMFSASTATEQVEELCKCFVDGIPSVDAARCAPRHRWLSNPVTMLSFSRLTSLSL
jgi:hypothetical protein